MKIHESAENYLEAILVLSQNKTEVRSIDVANYMNFSKPSVSVAMKQLRQNGYIQMDANGFLTLAGGIIITFAKEILGLITGG